MAPLALDGLFGPSWWGRSPPADCRCRCRQW